MFSNTKIAVFIYISDTHYNALPPPHTLPSPYACPIWSAYFTQPEFVYNNVACPLLYTQN
jgi:hypothetical protein